MTSQWSGSLLDIRGLTVIFETSSGEKSAVANATFQIFPGETVGVLGESGSGKTTLASAILGLLPSEGHVASGSIQFSGQELIGLEENKLRTIRGAATSMIWQEPRIALNPVMKIGTQVTEVVRAHSSSSASQCREAAMSALKDVRLDAERVYNAFPHELSGGQCQRVAIAQALVCRPRLVIADEPTSSLDSTVQREILELLLGLRTRFQIAFLFITHNPAIVAKLADRVLVMRAGEIVEQGDAKTVLESPSHPYTRMLLQARGRLLQSATSMKDRTDS
jgi:ABC-type dipeptide/oligopeptide/nickel transport system ATPase component